MPPQNLISNINTSIIQWCCDEISIALHDLAAAVKIPLKKIQHAQLSFNQLTKIADYFGYDPLFFLASEPPQGDKVHSAAFRTLANQEILFDRNIKKIVEQVESHRDLYLSLRDDMGEPHRIQLPQLTGSISDKAQTTREWLKIKNTQNDDYDFNQYRQLIEAKGILIFRSMGYNGKWKVKNDALIGFSIHHATAPTIFITKTSLHRQTFTLFHELGHLLLHQGSFIDNNDNLQSDQHSQQEREANQFAARCLLPDALVSGDLIRGATPTNYNETLQPLAKQLGISVEVIVVDLLNKNFITPADYDTYKEINQQRNDTTSAQSVNNNPIPRIYRHREPRHIFGETYVKTVLDSLNSQRISLNRASDYLDRLKISDLKKLSSNYG